MHYLNFDKDKKLKIANEIKALAYGKAKEIRNSIEHYGDYSQGTPEDLMDYVDAWNAGIHNCVPEKLNEYYFKVLDELREQERIEKIRNTDPEYKEYERLKSKFEPIFKNK